MENQPKRSRSSSPHSPQSPRDVQNLQIDSDDSEGQDLFGPELDRDYRENVNLDRYDDESDDQLNFDPMDQETRLVAEAHMRSRDRRMGKPVAFVDNDLPDLPQRRSRFRDEFADFDQNDDQVNPLDLDALRDPKGPLAQFVMMEAPLKTIKLEFHRFLTGYIDAAGLSVYGERIKLMCQNESCSLEIDYPHLFQANATLTYYLVNSPVEMLDVFDQVAMQVVLAAFENYDSIHTEIHCRIAGLPVSESLRDLRQTNLNTLVRVSGVVTRRSGVFPQLKYVKYDCLRCGALLGPFYQDSIKEIKLNRCSSCQAPGPFQINSEQTLYRNYQRLTLQETPGSVLAGRLPRSRDVICLWDLVDCARPGEQIDLTGIYKNTFDIGLNTRNGFPVFSTLIQANHIAKRTRAATATTEQDIAEIRQLATDPQIRQRVIQTHVDYTQYCAKYLWP